MPGRRATWRQYRRQRVPCVVLGNGELARGSMKRRDTYRSRGFYFLAFDAKLKRKHILKPAERRRAPEMAASARGGNSCRMALAEMRPGAICLARIVVLASRRRVAEPRRVACCIIMPAMQHLCCAKLHENNPGHA